MGFAGGGINVYRYVFNAPNEMIDASGRAPAPPMRPLRIDDYIKQIKRLIDVNDDIVKYAGRLMPPRQDLIDHAIAENEIYNSLLKDLEQIKKLPANQQREKLAIITGVFNGILQILLISAELEQRFTGQVSQNTADTVNFLRGLLRVFGVIPRPQPLPLAPHARPNRGTMVPFASPTAAHRDGQTAMPYPRILAMMPSCPTSIYQLIIEGRK